MDSEVDQMTENPETPKSGETAGPGSQPFGDEMPGTEAQADQVPSAQADAPMTTASDQGECPRTVPTAQPGWFPGAHPAPAGGHPTSQPPHLGQPPYGVQTPNAGQPFAHSPVPPASPWAPSPGQVPWQPPHAQAPGYGTPPPHQAQHQWPGSPDSQAAPGAGGQGHWGQPPSWPPPPVVGVGSMGHWPAAPAQKPRQRARTTLVTALVFCVAVTGLLGALIGHAVWSSTTSSAGLQNTGTGTPFKTSNGGNGGSGSSSPGTSAQSIASKVDPGLVDVNTTLKYEDVAGAGTGMVLTSNGLVLTNNHVIEGATSISVTDIGNGRTYGATVLGYDRNKDVAVLQLTDASGLSTVTLSTSTASTGDNVVAVGNAGGTGGTPSYAAGTITSTNQSITASDEATGSSEQLTGLLETNANIVPGDSGGPLVNSSGDVLAMDTAAAQGFSFNDQGSQGYAIPITVAASIARSIEAGSASTTVHIGATAFLGVQVESPSAGGSGTSGAYIASVVAGDPASNAGLVEGDTITSLGGTAVASPEALTTVMMSQKPGNSVQVQYINTSGSQATTTVQLGSGPPQ
jgi:S1-C subfamily serine protease